MSEREQLKKLAELEQSANPDINTFPASTILALLAELEQAEKFKKYVHDRLDDMCVDKHEEQNAINGCRIGSRLDDVVSATAGLIAQVCDERKRAESSEAALRTLRQASAKVKLPDSYEVEVLPDSGNGREGLYQVHVNGGFAVFGGTKEDAERQAEKVRAHYAEVLANRSHQTGIAEALKQAVSEPRVVNWGRHGHALVKVHFRSAKEAETFRAALAAEGGK